MVCCCPARIRTWIDRSPFAKACVGRLGFEPRINSSKGCCPTVRRPPRVNFGVGRAGKVCCPHLFGGSPMRRLSLDDRAKKWENERGTGLEPAAFSLATRRSTTELPSRLASGAAGGVRTLTLFWSTRF